MSGCVPTWHARPRTARCKQPFSERDMFFFFSKKLGWIGSILLSVVGTLLLLLLLGVF